MGKEKKKERNFLEKISMWLLRYNEEKYKYEVGYNGFMGIFIPIYEFRTEEEAADKVHYLNGGKKQTI